MENLLDLGTAGGAKDRKLTAATLRRLPIASEGPDELIRTLESLARRRAEGATNKNEHSVRAARRPGVNDWTHCCCASLPQSRSHAVYCVHIEYRVPANAALRHVTPPPPCLLGGAPESPDVSVMPVGTFGVCDLAGAECESESGGRGDNASELNHWQVRRRAPPLTSGESVESESHHWHVAALSADAAATEGREGERRLEGGRNNLGLMSLKAAFRSVRSVYQWATVMLLSIRNALHQLRCTDRYLGDCAAARAAMAGDGSPLPALPPFSWSRSTPTRILRPFFTTPGSRLLLLVTASPDDADAAQTAQALTEGVLIAGRPLMPRSVVEVGPAPPPPSKHGGSASARGPQPGAKRPILRAGSGHGGGQAVAAARAAVIPTSARVSSSAGGRR